MILNDFELILMLIINIWWKHIIITNNSFNYILLKLKFQFTFYYKVHIKTGKSYNNINT